MKKNTGFLCTLLGVAVLFGCGKDEDAPAPAATVAARTELNVSYGTDPRQRLDLYLPEGRSAANTKVVVLIHGGAWLAGDKTDFNPLVDTIKKYLPDYAIVNLNYRLAAVAIPAVNPWPTQMNDVNAAINSVMNNAANYQINTGKMVIIGASAGGQLGMIRSYAFNSNNHVKAMVNLFGPTDLVDLYNTPPVPNYPQLLTLFLSGTPQSNPASYASASPITMVNAGDPPTIIFHGTADATVPVRQSDSLQVQLTRNNVTSEYMKYTGLGHGDWPAPVFADVYTRAIAFIRRHNP